MPPLAIPEALNLAVGHHQARRLSDAEGLYRAVLEGRAGAARADLVVAHCNLGALLRDLGRPGEAEENCRRAIALDPDFALAHVNLGNAMHDMGRLDEAVACFRAALDIAPNLADAWGNVGAVLYELDRFDEAAAALLRALAIKPDYAEARNNLGSVLRELGRLEEAEAAYREAIRLEPRFHQAHNNLGALLANCGRAEEAVSRHREALRLAPNFASAHSNLIFALDLVAGMTAEGQQSERRLWYERHARQFQAGAAANVRARVSERPLRIGYVSADFRRHSAASVFAGILTRHDRDRFGTYCYSNAPPQRDDDVTERLKAAADGWRVIFGVSDAAAAAQIQADEIDILVDLSGYSAGQRLLVFARRPAPVQITAWGAATGTGLATMDYMFGDPVSIPHELRRHFAEKIIDLPCLAPFEPLVALPPVTRRAIRRPGEVTYGCFNRLAKVTTATLTLLGRVLLASPSSRLLFKGNNFDNVGVQARICESIAALGVARERLSFRGGSGYADHLTAYGDVDIALDPTPLCGGVSTYDALCMGVPVVTLKGATTGGRFGAAILTALDLEDWVADTTDQYVAIAVRKALDTASLAALRASLRSRFARSSVGNLNSYTRAVEAAYRAAWRGQKLD